MLAAGCRELRNGTIWKAMIMPATVRRTYWTDCNETVVKLEVACTKKMTTKAKSNRETRRHLVSRRKN